MFSIGTTDFSSLAKKYGSFAVPQHEIYIGGSLGSSGKLSVKEFPVLSINVSQSVSSSSSAQISFACPFSMESGKFETDVYKKLKPSTKITIKLGYAGSAMTSSEVVFTGLIGTLHTEFGPSGVTVNVTCYDAIMLLFHNVHWRSFEKKTKVSDVVKAILEPCLDFCNSLKVDTNDYDRSIDSKDAARWVQDYMDDYKFILRLASITNSSFYSSAGILYFTDNIAEQSKASVSLGWGSGLMSFSADIDSSTQVGTVQVTYRDAENKSHRLEYDGSDIKGDGKLARDEYATVKIKQQETRDVMVRNDTQAKTLAKSTFLNTAIKYVTAKGSTIGIPDIKAGDAIKITRVGDKLSGVYVLTQVTHQYSAGGYLTNFTCQRAKI